MRSARENHWLIVTAGRGCGTPTRRCAYDRIVTSNFATAGSVDAIDPVTGLPDVPAMPEQVARRPRRVEAHTEFTRAQVTVGHAQLWRYHFGAADAPSIWAETIGAATSDLMPVIDARAGVPSMADETASHQWVGSPVVAWVNVAASIPTRTDAAAPKGDDVDRLLQVCVDQAVALEVLPAVGAVAVCVIVAPFEPLRGAVVAVTSLVQARAINLAEVHRYRCAIERCLVCDHLDASLASPNRLVHDGTCFGAVVRDHDEETRRKTPTSAWVVPWAHASTLAAITEDERRDLAHAIDATVPWLIAQGSTWRLWFHQAPAGDDTGDVHLVGRWQSDWGCDSDGWP